MLFAMVAPSDILGPALLAGLVAIGATVAIERFGGRIGGLLATVPTTIVPASIGIAAESPSLDATRAALYAVPAGMLLNVGFLWLWRVLPPKLPGTALGARLATMTTTALSAWLIAAVAVVTLLNQPLAREYMSALGWAGTFAMVLAGAMACHNAPPAPKGTNRVAPTTLLLRGVLAAIAIGVSVVIAAYGGGTAAGVASVFPAIFLTTMVSLWLAQGEAVPAGAVGPMMLGSAAVGAHACLAATTLPAFGPILGSALAWGGAVLGATLPAGLWLQSRREHFRAN